MEYSDFAFEATDYLKRCIEVLTNFEVPFERFDHLGYDCDCKIAYERIRRRFEAQHGLYCYTSFISGRRISLIRLKVPIRVANHAVEFLELSEQKPDGSQHAGFDHAEVLPNGCSIGKVARTASQSGLEVRENKKPHHTTYDIHANGVVIKLSSRPLLEKIKTDEFI